MTLLHESGTLTAARSGNATVTIITPGVGSSGTYPRETIEQAATDRVFHAGLLMFADHATEADTWARPEGSITNLVGVLAEDARWDSSADGLVAEVRIFEHWKPIIRDMAESIGVSIRAAGEVEETADGHVVKRLTEARSVDFVTKAGRGGRVMEVLESARPTTLDEITDLFRPSGYQNHIGWAAVGESGPELINFKAGRQLAPSTISEGAITPEGILRGTVAPARGIETNPAPAGKEAATESQEGTLMGHIQIEESAHAALTEKASRADTLETQLAEANTKIETLEAETSDLKAEKTLATIRKVIDDVFEAAGVTAPTIASTLAETVINRYGGDETKAKEAAESHVAELAPAGGVTNLGESRPAHTPTQSDDEAPTWDELAAVKGA
jgi:hypothetical protein